MVRSVARKWLHLPHDVPKALFHAYTADDGFGIPELPVQVPLMCRARVSKLFDRCEENRDPVLAAVVRMSGLSKVSTMKWLSLTLGIVLHCCNTGIVRTLDEMLARMRDRSLLTSAVLQTLRCS